MSTRKRIHPPYFRFKKILKGRGITYVQLASLLNMSSGSVGDKINGFSDFYISEMEIIEEKLSIPHSVFFEEKSGDENEEKG